MISYIGTGIHSTMKWAHRRHHCVTPLLLPLHWSCYIYELLCLKDLSSSELISYSIFNYCIISSFYTYHSIILSHCDSIDPLEYIILLYCITILILIILIIISFIFCYSWYHIILMSFNCAIIISLYYSANILSHSIILSLCNFSIQFF